jgi:hypothetical protein
MASPGNGTAPHLAGELFKMMVGLNMVHVPYRGSAPALTDLIGGQVQVMFIGTAGVVEYIQAGRLRALAVTTATRADVLANLPTVGDFVPGYESSAWFGIGAPKNTPAEIIDKLNREINAAFADPNIKERLAELGGPPVSAHHRPLGGSSAMKPKSGPKSSNSRASSLNDRVAPCDNKPLGKGRPCRQNPNLPISPPSGMNSPSIPNLGSGMFI